MIPLFEIFKALELELSGKLTINNSTENLEKNSQAQESIYRLFFPYKNQEICLEYAVGAQHVAAVSVLIETLVRKPEFEINTLSPFTTLFRGKKNKVQIKCEDSNFKSLIESNKFFLELKELSISTGFEPCTYGKNIELGYNIRTEYHLRFPERTKEFPSIIGFYKSLIDNVV